MIDFSDKELSLIVRALDSQFLDLEHAYKKNVNSNESFAKSLADCIVNYNNLRLKITGFPFLTDSVSLQRMLSFKLENT